MDDNPTGKMTASSSSSLAITEKRPHRPGGCAGIFFQLLDWNRRLAKKKLFAKKLLPPVRPKQSSSKFGRDEKLPKFRLIANENSGGFPNVKKNGRSDDDPDQNLGMRSPGLVARLMGLDSMPPVQQDKTKKASLFECGSDKRGGLSSHNRLGEKDSHLEKGSAKGELRPQKLQKTGHSERQPLSRFGAEALQIKSVVSRSRKHHTKLASTLKSPRMTSGRNASRLIDAAARILEPGLQATNRAKCALTYSNTMHHVPKDEVKMDETMAKSVDISKISNYPVTKTARSLKEQSCKNCGSSLHVADSSLNVVEQPLPFASSVNHSFPGSEMSKPSPAVSSLEREKERVSQRSREQTLPFTPQARINTRTHAEAIAKRKPLNLEDEIQWHWTSQQCKPQKDRPSSTATKNKMQNQVLLSRDRVRQRSSLCSLHSNRVSSAANAINETRKFVALNQSLSSTQSRMPVKVDIYKCDVERKSCNRQDGSPTRKKRSINVNQQGESSGFISSSEKQRNVRCDAMAGVGMGHNAHSVNRIINKNIMAPLEDSSRTSGDKDSGVFSFTFSSPMKQKAEGGIAHNGTQNISNSDKTSRKMNSEKAFPLNGDALGALLEQKLKELNCPEEDELATGGTRPKRTTAMILQELISALTAESPDPHDDMAVGSDGEKVSRHSDHSNTKLTFQDKEKTIGASLGHLCDNEHRSPGSVLEASFSNDSCLSSSVDDSSASNLHPDSMDCSYDGPQPLLPDAELSDSATSLSKVSNGLDLMTNLLRHVSEVLDSIGFADTGLKGSKMVHAEEVILNSELVFRNAALQNSDRANDFSLSQFLNYGMGTLGSVLRAEFGHFILSVEDTKDGNQLKQFLFDCVIEHLDSRYGPYSLSGFKAWSRKPLCITTNILITGVVDEVRRWLCLAGKIPDEIIEWEMSHSLGKWTDFEIEAYETGAEIDGELLQMLVDEVVIDLCD